MSAAAPDMPAPRRDSVANGWVERKPPPTALATPHAAPHRRRIRGGRIPTHDQPLQLMRFEGGGCRPTRGPPAKAPTREPLLRQPKALRVVDQTLNRGPASIPKHEQRPAEGISVEDLAADAGQPVNPFTKILGVDGHQDSHLRGDLDHASMP